MYLKSTTLLLTVFALSLTQAQETQGTTFGKGLFNLVGQDSTWSMKVATRMQFLAVSDWEDDTKNEANFLLEEPD